MFRSAQNKRLNITTAICAQPSKEVVRISLEKVSSCLEVRVVKTGSENCFQCKEICQNFSNVPSYPISRDWKVNTYSNSHSMRFQGQSWFKLSFFLYLYCRRQDDVTDDSQSINRDILKHIDLEIKFRWYDRWLSTIALGSIYCDLRIKT